jgi:hypothetical protein
MAVFGTVAEDQFWNIRSGICREPAQKKVAVQCGTGIEAVIRDEDLTAKRCGIFRENVNCSLARTSSWLHSCLMMTVSPSSSN